MPQLIGNSPIECRESQGLAAGDKVLAFAHSDSIFGASTIGVTFGPGSEPAAVRRWHSWRCVMQKTLIGVDAVVCHTH